MPPPSRSPGNPSAVSPSLSTTARENYATATPFMNRHTFSPRNVPDLMCRSIRPPMAPTPKSSDPSVSLFSSPPNTVFSNAGNAMQLDAATRFSFDAGNIPPFDKTKCLYTITTADRQPVHPDIQARIDKGFFKADQDWTCYRRNYFSIACSYTLKPPYLDSQPLYLHRPSANPETIHAFAISISAVVDGEGGKPVELVQYTPKRDTGAKNSPDKIKLLPHSTGSLGVLSGVAPGPSGLGMPIPGGASHLSGTEYDQSHTPSASSSQDQTVANFDRIQFKHATANNGKRRAAQQYYNLVAELYAGILDGSAGSNDVRWVKVATRISAPMVVRGRSPGHYSDERRGSSASNGPGGPSGGGDSGDSGASSINPGSAGPSSGARSGLPSLTYNSNTRRGGGVYQSHHLSYSNSPSGSASFPSSSSSSSSYGGPSTADHAADQTLTTEEGCPVPDYSGYQCYTSPLYDGSSISNNGMRTHLPALTLPASTPRYDHQRPVSRLDASFGYLIKAQDPRNSGKDELHQYHSATYPSSLSSPWYNNPFGSGSRCGKFQQLNSSRSTYSEMPAL